MAAQELNRDLIGVPGGRGQLQTPALVIELDVMERNIARMADRARKHNIALRPHAKTHKCSEIARRQMEADASGICTAKVGEAEALADAGVESILITSPVVTERGIRRLVTLNARLRELMVVCDNGEIATRLNAAAAAGGKALKVLVDIDPGMGRTGVAPNDAIALVQQVAKASRLEYAGLQCYAGNLQHLESRNERHDAVIIGAEDAGAAARCINCARTCSGHSFRWRHRYLRHQS